MTLRRPDMLSAAKTDGVHATDDDDDDDVMSLGRNDVQQSCKSCRIVS